MSASVPQSWLIGWVDGAT